MGPDLTIVITCPDCGADINWRLDQSKRSELTRAVIGKCTMCRVDIWFRVQLGYVTKGVRTGPGRIQSHCAHCGTEFDSYFATDSNGRSNYKRETCSHDCWKARLSVLAKERLSKKAGQTPHVPAHPVGTITS